MVNTRGYTYLLHNGTHYKIGITTGTVTKRVVELQTGSPTKIEISGYSYNQNALEMEQWLHAKFHSKRLEGEWFALNNNDVAIIHHHFETHYLDEYLAPLSERAIEILKSEAERIKKEVEAKEERILKKLAERKKEVAERKKEVAERKKEVAEKEKKNKIVQRQKEKAFKANDKKMAEKRKKIKIELEKMGVNTECIYNVKKLQSLLKVTKKEKQEEAIKVTKITGENPFKDIYNKFFPH